jgi:FkbM family methyltransferase
MLGRLSNLHQMFSTHPLSRDAPAQAWIRFVKWQIQSRLQNESIVPWISGQRLAVKNGMTGATGNIYLGLHEFTDMGFLLHFLREGDLFLDVGANIGSYTILASGVCRATSWAFEPDPNTAAHLKRNISLNGLGDFTKVFECAVGDSRKQVSFTIGLDTINKVAESGENVRLVQQEKLDDIIGANEPIMMKMDVEGYEENAIRGASDLLRRSGMKAIEIETVNDNIVEMITSNNFKRAYYDPFSRRLTETENGLRQNNHLFVRDWPFIEKRVATAPKIEVLGRSI